MIYGLTNAMTRIDNSIVTAKDRKETERFLEIIQQLDGKLRKNICKNCGRPILGVLLEGQTMNSAGLCHCLAGDREAIRIMHR